MQLTASTAVALGLMVFGAIFAVASHGTHIQVALLHFLGQSTLSHLVGR